MIAKSTIMMLGLWALLAVGACGEEAPPPCPAYACVNMATLSGTVVVDQELHELATHFCFENDCRDGIISFDVTTAQYCTSAVGGEPWACADRMGEQAISLQANWPFSEADPILTDGSSFRLLVSDRASGEVVLDVTRTATSEITREDSCHQCWTAAMTF